MRNATASAGRLKTAGRGSRSERVYLKLREAIHSGRLKPGERIMEMDVANWLQVSRTPVRDAIRRLEGEGMLEHEARFGLVIAKLDQQAVMELYVMREVLESTAARLCARQASDMELIELGELVKIEQQLRGDPGALAKHNRRFHETIHRAAHNRFLLKSLHAVNDSMGLLGKSQMLLPHRAKAALAEHAEIVRAIQKRDPDAAAETARRHVRAAQRERLKRLFPGPGG